MKFNEKKQDNELTIEELFKNYDGTKFQAEIDENHIRASLDNLKLIEELNNGVYDENTHTSVDESLKYLNS